MKQYRTHPDGYHPEGHHGKPYHGKPEFPEGYHSGAQAWACSASGAGHREQNQSHLSGLSCIHKKWVPPDIRIQG